ncbi:MAG TPA: hypothetical protein VFZ06_11105 [Acidimicrobiia bacterium]|nr:hypothetical protein [Acidimicrobiia bacterium]
MGDASIPLNTWAGLGIRTGATALGLEVRIGVHTGEMEIEGDDVLGVAVHETARIAADARGDPGVLHDSAVGSRGGISVRGFGRA